MKWFSDGDRNTRFYHNYAKGRRKRLIIHEITTTQRNIINQTKNIEAEEVCFFERQFARTEQIEDEDMIKVILKMITKD